MDVLSNRQMPYSAEAEQAVIGSMLIDSRCIADVLGLVSADDFYIQQNRDIFETIYTMFNYSCTIDPVTVLEQMHERGVYDESGSRTYVMQLMEITPTAANAAQYAQIVADMSMLRRLISSCEFISQAAYSREGSADDILELAEQRIYALRKGQRTTGLEHISSILTDVFDRLAALAEAGNEIPGLSTGLKDLDRQISGLNRSDLMLIAARPGMGKSSIALNIALDVAKATRKTVAIFSLEMSQEQMGMRLLSNESFVDNQKLLTGKLSEDDWDKISLAAAALSKTDIRVDDNPTITVAEMNAQCRRLDNLGLVIIDYLQLMTSSGYGKTSDNRVTAIGDISRSLKIMAKELNIPVICLSQLSRANEGRSDKRPMLSDLRESGAIEQDADEVIFIYRDDYYNKDSDEKNIAELIVAKNRHGETGTIKVSWLPQFTTFADLDWRHG